MRKGILLERDLVASAEAEAVEEVLGLEPDPPAAAGLRDDPRLRAVPGGGERLRAHDRLSRVDAVARGRRGARRSSAGASGRRRAHFTSFFWKTAAAAAKTAAV